MTHIFRHKLVLRATVPISFQSDFKKLDLNIVNHSKKSDSLFCDFVESICWKICRETQVACIFIPFNGFKIHLIYQKEQSKAVKKAVTELERHFAYLKAEVDRTADEDAGSSTLMVKAVECGMISALLNHGWTSLENGLMINGNIALMEEGAPVEAVSVGLQIEADDRIVFIIAPDVVRFHRLKICDLLPTGMKQRYDNGHEINLEDWLWHYKDDGALDQIRCFILPSLIEGFIIGLSKLLPQAKEFEESNQLWLHKHGLELSKVCYYVKVQYTFDDEIFKTWFPSALVIKGSGLMPVTHTLRATKVGYVHDNFRRSIAAWNFFEGGTPTFQDFDQINPSQDVSTWVTAKDALQPPCFRKNHRDNPCVSDASALCSLTAFFSSLDFRRPKLVSAMMEPNNKDIQSFAEGNMSQYRSSPIPRAIPMNTAKIVPHFINRLVVHGQNETSDFHRPKLVSTTIESKNKDIQNLAEAKMNQYHTSPIPKAVPMNTAKIVPHFINRLVVQGQNVTSGHKIGASTNKTLGSDILTKDLAAMSNKLVIGLNAEKIVEADNCITPSIPTEVRQCPLKAPSFARRKSLTGKAESKNTSIKNAVAGITNVTTRIQNGIKVSKKKPHGTDRKIVPGSLQKIPKKAKEGASTGSKKTKDLSKGLDSKKEVAYSAENFQASDTKRNTPEKGRLSGHNLKVTKSPNGQMPQAATLLVELQHTETAGSIDLSQDIWVFENSCVKSFSAQTPACAIDPVKGSKRKTSSGTEDEIDVFKVKTKEGETECSLKKARPEQKVDAALPDQTGILVNSHCEVIPGMEIKHNNAKKRTSVAIDLTALDEKVRDCHSKGNLKSLTVPELKSFLSANKTKVGGKKEELIQRITSLLSS